MLSAVADADLLSQTATVEHVCGAFNHSNALRACLGLPAASLELEVQRELGQPIAVAGVWPAGGLDVHQQVHQAAGPLCPLPGRFPPLTRLHPLRLVPWLDQGLRYVHP